MWARTSLPNFSPEPFDVVVHDLSKVLPWQLHRASRVPTVAIVRHVNGRLLMREAPVLTGPAFWAAERFYRFAYGRTPIVTEALATRKTLVDLGLPSGSIRIVRPGVDHGTFYPEPSKKTTVPEILFVGRLKPYKSADLAIGALKLLRQHVPRAHLTIAGRGPERDRLERFAERMGLEDAVTFAGFVSADRLAELYRQSWVHVQPSVVEGWGLTAIEAAACGTPTVAYRAGALVESVGPLSAPFLTEERTSAALAGTLERCISALSNDPNCMSEGLTEYARSFDWDQTAGSYERILMDVASTWAHGEPAAVGSALPAFAH